LTSRENAALLKGFRAVDEIIALDRARFQSWNPAQIVRSAYILLRGLRREPFSLAFDFQSYGETELMSWWSGAPERWGFANKAGRGWAYTGTSIRSPEIHPVDWNLSLLRAAGLNAVSAPNEYFLPDEDLARGREYFRSHKLEASRPTLFLQPFTSNPGKNWPLKNFLELAAHGRSAGWQIIFGGGPAESAALEPARAAGFVVAAGAPLMVSAGLMKLSGVVVGGDTGLVHLAVAMQKRVVMLMEFNTPGSCHPFQHPDWAVTAPVGKRMPDIEMGKVINVVERALAEVAVVK